MESSLKWKIAQQLEVRWWRNYLKNKSPEEYITWKKSYWNNFLTGLKDQLPVLSGLKILDAGCGPAGINLVLENNQVTAFDPLIEKYRTLPHFLPKETPWVDFQTATLESFHAENEYDLIFCLNAINHVSDIEKSYDNLVAALKPGGTLVVSTDAHNHVFLKHIFRLIPGDALHPHQYDLKEYEDFLMRRNCQLISSVTQDIGNIFNYVVSIAKKIA